MPWTQAQNRMWHARAARGDATAQEVLAKPDYTVTKKGGKADKKLAAMRRRRKHAA